MMYFSWNPGTVVDEENRPVVAGRVSVFVHDSNVLASVYTMEGDQYVPAQNPQFLDDYGRLQATLFAELGIYDVKIEKASGDTYEDFDHFEIGIDAKLDQVGRDSVKSVEELMDLDPSVSSSIVTVESYPVRNYLWDPDAIDTADGGVVVDSDVADRGKWLLLWDSPYLPSSVYGVKDGDSTNINALFSYASVIGSMNIHTPPAVRLESGNYDLDGYRVCSKHLALEPGVTFSGTIGLRDDLEIFGNSEPGHAFGNFRFLRSGLTAHSSWFPDLDVFWHSGADILVVDGTNYFSSSTLRTTVDLSSKTVVGSGTKVTQYTNSACFALALDSTVPDNFFIPSTDFVRIDGTGFGDSVFRTTGTWDPGLVNDGHHVQFSNVPDLDLFQNAQRWLDVMVERRNRLSSAIWAEYTLDLQGRTCRQLYLSDTSFTTIKNADIGNIVTAGYSLTLENVRGNVKCNSTHALSLVVGNSRITVPRFGVKGLASLSSVNSDIVLDGEEGIDPCDCSLFVYGGTWTGAVKMTDAHCNAYAISKEITFRNVFINGDYRWKVNYVFMAGCTSSNPIDLYPAAGGDNFFYNCELHDNHFTGAFRLWITYWWNEDNPHYEVSGTRVKFNRMSITDNRFDTSDQYGIKMTCYNVKGLTYYCCAAPQNLDMGTWTYSGNTGSCPKMTPGTMDNRYNWSRMYELTSQGIQYRCASENYNLFVPYFYDRSQANVDGAPSPYLNPANPTQRVMATIHGEDWKDSWAFACTWPVNGISTPEQLADEDYNNRFYTEVWMTREDGNVPDWHIVGDGKNAYTTFNVPIF